MIKGVIFDYKAVLVNSAPLQSQVTKMFNDLRSRGLSICIFSTDEMNIIGECDRRDLPHPDFYIHRGYVTGGKNRGSPEWINALLSRFPVEPYDLFYVGATKLDWRTAINSAVMYAHAGWTGGQPGGTTSIVIEEPEAVTQFIDTFLLVDPRWSYVLSDAAGALEIRALLPASASLPSTPTTSFRLQDVFTYDRKPMVGAQQQHSARDLLMMHVVTSCYLEGLLVSGTHFCVYPSSTMGNVSPQLQEYVRPASRFVHGFYKDDLLERYRTATDTSLERVNARKQNRAPNVSILDQANSVKVAETYANGKLAGRTVVVFDDFMTKGTSLSWASQLLSAAGAAKVVLVSIGKYGGSGFFQQVPTGTISAFAEREYLAQDFDTEQWRLTEDPANQGRLQELFASLAGS